MKAPEATARSHPPPFGKGGLGGILCLLLAACATTTAPPPPPAVRIVSETAIPPADPPPVEIAAEDLPAEEPPAEDPEDPAADELANGVDEPLTTSEALAEAIEWTAEGLRLYERGDPEAARRKLADARIVLLEAELPEVMQERGLTAIHGALPDELRHYDPETVLAELELESEANDASELAERAYIRSEARRILRRFDAAPPDERYLEVFVDQVSEYIRYYQGSQRELFERAFARKHKYWPTIQRIFEAKGIPVELGYMALVESGFNPRARSRADARGLWQFIPSTGRRYQLRRLEDLYDVEKSTEAASEYLLDLIGIFGSRSFLLAMAAYNSGEMRVQGCLRQLDDPFGGRSFWEIRDCLARETRGYVPRIMAAAVIGSDPHRFGFDLETEDEVRERYDVVTIPRPTPLSALASRAGVSVADLRTANTDLASNATSTPVRNFPLYVPKGGGPPLEAALESQPEERAPARTRRPVVASPPEAVEPVVYRVARGDTLSEIAARFGLSYRELAAANGLAAPYRLRVGQTLAVPARDGGRQRIVYTVRRGNTLQSIANVFSVRYRDLMRWNDLSSSFLKAGQKLVIEPPRPVRVETYRVERGDTVARIARRFGVPVRDVLTANGLGARTLIRPGQRLVVYVP